MKKDPLDLYYGFDFHFVKCVYLLKMNPIRGRCESNDRVAWSHSSAALKKFVKSLRVGSYEDFNPADQSSNVIYGPAWIKSFKRGSPLEWYNDRWRIEPEDDRAIDYVRSKKGRLGKKSDVYLISGFFEIKSTLWVPDEQNQTAIS